MRYFGINPHTNDLVSLGEHKTALEAWGARNENGHLLFHEQNFIYIVNDIDLMYWRRTIQNNDHPHAWFGINTSTGRLEYLGDFNDFAKAQHAVLNSFKWCGSICWIFDYASIHRWKDVDVSVKHESWSKYE